jgi:hypothetical protein
LWNSGLLPFNKYFPTLPCIEDFSFLVNCGFLELSGGRPRIESLIDSKAELAFCDKLAKPRRIDHMYT